MDSRSRGNDDSSVNAVTTAAFSPRQGGGNPREPRRQEELPYRRESIG